jgi:hypothetical protein
MAQAAGAVAMVVANTDRETFGTSVCGVCGLRLVVYAALRC